MSHEIPTGCGVETCESCGSQFSCGAKLRGCWCADMKLTDDARARLAGRFRRCLCRPCLEGIASQGHAEAEGHVGAGGVNLSDAVNLSDTA